MKRFFVAVVVSLFLVSGGVSVANPNVAHLAGQGPSDGPFSAWTKQMASGNQIKFYAKYLQPGQKVQFMFQNDRGLYEEFAWKRVGTETLNPDGSYADMQNHIYFIRTFDLSEGKNRVRILLDGELVWGTKTYSIKPPSDTKPSIAAGEDNGVAPYLVSGLPTLKGDPSIGGELSVTSSQWSDPTERVEHNWFSCENLPDSGRIKSVPASCTPIASDRSSLQIGENLTGTFVFVETLAINNFGVTQVFSRMQESISPQETPPSLQYAGEIVGALAPLKTLYLDPGSWTGTGSIDVSTKWYRCPSPSYDIGITGSIPSNCTYTQATGNEYTVQELDRGSFILSETIASNGVGETRLIRQSSSPIPRAGAAPALISESRLTGLARVGSVIEAGQSSWSSTTPLSTDYEWFSCGDQPSQSGLNVPVPSTCSSTGFRSDRYTSQSSDIGNFLALRERVSNEFGSATYLYVVRSPIGSLDKPPAYLNSGSIKGSFVVGQRLSFENGNWSGAGPISFSYDVLLCASAPLDGKVVDDCLAKITKSSSLTDFTVSSSGDVGKYVVVRVAATNSVGSAQHIFVSYQALSSVPVAPDLVRAPQIVSNSNTVGEEVSVIRAEWSGESSSEYFYRVCIFDDCGDGGTEYFRNTLVIDSSMTGKYIQMVEIATIEGGPSSRAVSNSIGPVIETSPPTSMAGNIASTHLVSPGQTVRLRGYFNGNPSPTKDVRLGVCESAPQSYSKNAIVDMDSLSCEMRQVEKSGSSSDEYWNYVVKSQDVGKFLMWKTEATGELGRSEDTTWALVIEPGVVFNSSADNGSLLRQGTSVSLENPSGLSDVRAHLCDSRYSGQTTMHFQMHDELISNCSELTNSYGPEHTVIVTADMYSNGSPKWIAYSGIWQGHRIWTGLNWPVLSMPGSYTAPLASGVAEVGKTLSGSDIDSSPEGLSYSHAWYSCASPRIRAAVFTNNDCLRVADSKEIVLTDQHLNRYLVYVREISSAGSAEVLVRISSNGVWVKNP